MSDAPARPSQSSAHPDWGLVVANHITTPTTDTPTGRQASKDENVTYDLNIYTESGVMKYLGVSPSQNRYDCWFYPSPANSIADVYWEEGKMHFTVLELPVTEPCSATGGTGA